MSLLRLLSEAEVAGMLKCSMRKMQRMRKQGRGIPWAKIGGAIRYSPADVDLFIREHEHHVHGVGSMKRRSR